MSKSAFKTFSICLLVIAILGLPGCSGGNKKPVEQKLKGTSQQKPKTPKEMKSILTDLEQIIAGVEQKIIMTRTSNLQKNTRMSGQNQQGEQGGQEGQGQSQQGQQQQSGGQASAQNQMNNWQKEQTALKNLHRSWNSLEPEAVKAGLGIPARDAFEQSLEKLTLAISRQQKEESLEAATELYGTYADLVRIFDGSIPPEYFQTKYEVMTAVIEAGKMNWTAAEEHIPLMQKYWGYLKSQAQGQDQKLLNRSEYSIEDLAEAIMSHEIDPVLIKAEIVMSNLQDLQKGFSAQGPGSQ
ncbi:MAG: hypothetical protein ACOX6I_09695 [Syntrophomonadaceae bacterium]|jgi:hypothetical protein